MSSSNDKLIAVIGASGQQGGAVVRALQVGGQFRVRALTRNPGQHREPADEVVEADLERPETLKAAFEGAYGSAAGSAVNGRVALPHQALTSAAYSSAASSHRKCPLSMMASLLRGSRSWRNSALTSGTTGSRLPAMIWTGVWMVASRSCSMGRSVGYVCT